jgi:hypothetical protein
MRSRVPSGDASVLGALGVVLLLVTATTWRKWGWPSFDGGYDPSVADVIDHGGRLYDDVRYFYGPAGVYALAAAFKLLGTSLTVAFVFGYAQTLAILGCFYALARMWLAPAIAGLATLVLLTIAFSGTYFDFVLPHTDSATFGALFLLVQVLAFVRGRLLIAGLALGVLTLTRPEFIPLGGAALVGAFLGRARETGWAPALRLARWGTLPAIAIGGAALAYFASGPGLHNLLFEQLIPVDFIRATGNRLQGSWAPLDIESLVATVARAAIFGALLAGLVAAAERASERRGSARLAALWPLAAAAGALAVAGAAWYAVGVFPGTRRSMQDEISRLLIATSWLPVVAVTALVLVARRALRGGPNLATVGWTADLALVFAAAACGLRAYNRFDFDSYAPYYAALPVLVTAILLVRIGSTRPGARLVAPAVLTVMAVALAGHAYGGPYRHDTVSVHSPRGTFVSYREGASAIQLTIDYVHAHASGRQPIVVLPDSPGLHFVTGHPPALRDLTFLPGTLDSPADEHAAVRRLERTRPPLIVLAAQRTQQYGVSQIGVDYDRILLGYVYARYRRAATFGDVSRPTKDNLPPRAFTIFARR